MERRMKVKDLLYAQVLEEGSMVCPVQGDAWGEHPGSRHSQTGGELRENEDPEESVFIGGWYGVHKEKVQRDFICVFECY